MQLRKIWQFLEAYKPSWNWKSLFPFAPYGDQLYKQKFALKFVKNAGVV